MNKEIRDISFNFEKLLIWQNAMDFGKEINGLTSVFPEKEKFNFSSQILRAVDSVALNISEGSICQSNPEFRRLLSFSIRSLAEVVTCLHKAKRRNYITEEQFVLHYSESFDMMNMMIAFRNKLK